MANDTQTSAAPKRANRSNGKPGMNPLFAGILIGLLTGILLALGVAIWIERNSSRSFVEKAKPVEALPPVKVAPPAVVKGDPANPDKPRFEFYQILPGDKDAKGGNNAVKANVPANVPNAAVESAPKAAPQKNTVAATPEPTTKPAPATPIKTSDEVLYLQAGAFQNESDAENMKAKIAFAGFEASAKQVNLPGKGTLYRVRLGPYKSQDEVNRIKNVLSQNGITAAVVKPE